MSIISNPAEYYVYRYKDTNNREMYVGYGESVDRALSHQAGSHNANLEAFLDEHRYFLEIAGPFGSEEIAHAVETALISALQPKFNAPSGHTHWRFRPCGVPLGFVERLQEPRLTRDDFLRTAKSILFVHNTNRTFEDGRVGYDPANPPTDAQILEQLGHWWLLGPHIARWVANPEESPEVLVGVYGKPNAQIIIGAVTIAKNEWTNAAQSVSGNRYSVPTAGPTDLDACGWRGRRIDGGAGLKFGNIQKQHFLILGADRIDGGRNVR